MRGIVVIGMVRALRKWMKHTGATSIEGLAPEDMALLTDRRVTPEPWYPYDQYLRLMQASFDLLCRGDWTTLREYCSKGVAPVYELGYTPLLYVGDPERTMQAVSVLWRSCHSFGSAQARSDSTGTTIHVIGYPDVGELDGNVNAGWFLGMARCAGATVTKVEIRCRPWAREGDEQVVRLDWHMAARASDDERGGELRIGRGRDHGRSDDARPPIAARLTG